MELEGVVVNYSGLAALVAAIGLWWTMRSQLRRERRDREAARVADAEWRRDVERDIRELQKTNGRHADELAHHVGEVEKLVGDVRREANEHGARVEKRLDRMDEKGDTRTREAFGKLEVLTKTTGRLEGMLEGTHRAKGPAS